MLPTSSTKLFLCKGCWSSSWYIWGLFRWLLHWTSIQGNICWSMEANTLQTPPCLQGMSVQSIVLAWCQFSQSFHRGKSNPTACKITVTTAKYESSQALKSASTLENLELSQPYRRVQRPDVGADTFNSSVWESQEALSKCEAILVYLVSSRKTEP